MPSVDENKDQEPSDDFASALDGTNCSNFGYKRVYSSASHCGTTVLVGMIGCNDEADVSATATKVFALNLMDL